MGACVLIALAVALYGLSEARRDPAVRRITLPLADWPAGAKPVRAVLISDVHFGNLAMGRQRLGRIVERIDALKPDIVLIAGDFIAGHTADLARASSADLAAGLSRLRAPLGVVAVLGNHDYGTDVAAVLRTLARANITVLKNEATRRGPLAIGGIDDIGHRHGDIPGTMRALASLPGARIVMMHDPDAVRAMRRHSLETRLPDNGPRLIVAGHTHCGQIAVPGLGPVLTLIDHRTTFRCGVSSAGRDKVVVTSGVGTSILPIRIDAPPDLWVLTLGPAATRPEP
ncbi:hypothetical protein ASG11_02670 [Sphingomonas sp. Leaf357]|nr:hypothetical protein ASG11_02670 [Sphingomonas sp. Leaf357]